MVSRKRCLLLLVILASVLLVGLTPLTTAAKLNAPPGSARGGPPTRVQAVALGNQEVDLAWSAVPGATSYIIRRDKADLASVPATTLSYVDTTVQPATKYKYAILAVDATGASSPASDPDEVETPGLPDRRDTEPPSEPEDFTVTEKPDYVLLDWYSASDDTDVTGYVIYRDGQQLAVVDSSTTSYQDTTVAASTTYTYTVQARDAAGNTSAPSQATVTTPAAATPTASLTFGPDADTYVSQTNAATAHGRNTTLQADKSARQVFLRFTVSGLPAGARVASAKLRLFATNGSPTGGTVNSLSNITWSEAATTWNNRPTIDGPVVGAVGNAPLNTTVVVDVTPAITGNGTYSLAITSTSSDAVVYASKELTTVANRPRLVVTLAP